MRKLILLSAMITVLGLGQAIAQTTTTDDPLHGFCWGSTSCSDNGANTLITATSPNPPQFGFSISPGPQTGEFFLEILVPTTFTSTPSTLSFGVTGTQGGALNNLTLSGTATLFSSTPWNSGDLDAYLGSPIAGASPNNPIGAYAVGGSSYYVYQVDLGTNTLQANPDALVGPLLTVGSSLPVPSYIVGYLYEGCTTGNNGKLTCTTVATANSGAILEDGQVPEPGTLALFGTGLITAAGFLRRKLFS